MILVDLTLAIICFTSNGVYDCHKALVGKDTPTGVFQLAQLITNQSGYGGDVLVFDQNPKEWYAIHRVWLLNKKQKRDVRLKSGNSAERHITAGCINIDPVVYDKLKECCSTDLLTIIR